MAGRGPPPKAAKNRARRNKTSTAARLETAEPPRQEPPSLGEHPSGDEWHERTRQWWAEVWSSPMADEFLRADTDGLRMLGVLVDQFWKDPTPKLAAEIRLQRQCFGLTPIDRRRLQWEIVRSEEAERRRPRPPREDSADPREALKAVS